jgi:hypothetical protein
MTSKKLNILFSNRQNEYNMEKLIFNEKKAILKQN